jgi:hypothetical protein
MRRAQLQKSAALFKNGEVALSSVGRPEPDQDATQNAGSLLIHSMPSMKIEPDAVFELSPAMPRGGRDKVP